MTKRTKQIIAALLVWAYLLLNITSTLQANYLITPEAKPTLAFTDVVWPASASGYLHALASNPAPQPPANASPTTNTDHTNAPEFGFIASAIVNNAETTGAAPRMAVLPPDATQDGDWNDPDTWNPSGIPTSTSDLTIPSGRTVYISSDAVCRNLTIETGGTLIFNTASTLTISGNLQNDGTLTAESGTIAFVNHGSIISGSSTTSFNNLKVDTGSGSNVSSIISVSSTIDANNLLLENGLFQINGGTTSIAGLNNPSSNLLWKTIPLSAGIEINTGAILNTGAFTITNEGLIHIAGGTANFGTGIGNSVHTQVDGAFVVEGGIVNIAGRLESSAGSENPFPGTSFKSGVTVSSGTITLSTEGNVSGSLGSLNISEYGYFDFTGGTIVFEEPGSALDLQFAEGSTNGIKTITDGVFQFGNTKTAAGETFVINSAVPLRNITTYDNIDLQLAGSLILGNELALGTNSQINLNGNALRLPVTSSSLNFPLVDNSNTDATVSSTDINFSAGAYIELSMMESKHPQDENNNNHLTRYWTVNTSGITSYDVSAPIGSVTGDVNTLVASKLSGTNWIKTGTLASSTISLSGVTESSITFSATEEPTATISGTQTICEGESATITIGLTGAAPWSVTYTDGTTPTTITTSTSTYTFSVTPTSPTTYSLVSVSDTNMEGTVIGNAVIAIDPLPVADVNGSATICVNSSYTLAAGEASYDNGDISWAVTSGAGSITAGATSLTPTYTPVAADAGNTVTLTMTVTSNNSCGSATATDTYTI
ncbi:MAG: G8 domain-containing protein, partial [Mangrovibacterium sp.]